MSDKIKELLSKTEVSVVAFCLLVLKSVISNISIADSICFIAICGLYGFYLYQNKTSNTLKAKQLQEFEALKAEITGVKVALNMRKSHESQQKKDSTGKRLF